jgi:hypothetical protein
MRGADLDELTERLTARDLAIVADVERYRLLSSRQIQRLHFTTGHRSSVAAARACTRVLDRLRREDVLAALARRIGGVRKGSAGTVWYLGATGERLQRHLRGLPARRRFGEPSRHFVHHTLAVAELAVVAVEAERAGAFAIQRLDAEPNSWQPYLAPTGTRTVLKPDLALVARSGEFEDHWFLEADLDTEHLPVIVRQARAYAAFRASGRYEAAHGLFPRVVWVAPSQARSAAIRAALGRTSGLPGELFTTCTTADFAAVIAGGAAANEEGTGSVS